LWGEIHQKIYRLKNLKKRKKKAENPAAGE